MRTTIHNCKLIRLPRILTETGTTSPVCTREYIGFDIARIYYLYDIPTSETRGGHAHRKLQQLLIAVKGTFEVLLDDGCEKGVVSLDTAYDGLYIPSLIWRELLNFSSGAICLVIASLPYDESDYIRDYKAFLVEKGCEV